MLSTYQPSKAIVWVHARACSSFSRCLPCASTFHIACFCWYAGILRWLNYEFPYPSDIWIVKCMNVHICRLRRKRFDVFLGENAIRQKGHPVYWWTKFDVMKYIVFSRNTCMYILNIARVAMANGKQQTANRLWLTWKYETTRRATVATYNELVTKSMTFHISLTYSCNPMSHNCFTSLQMSPDWRKENTTWYMVRLHTLTYRSPRLISAIRPLTEWRHASSVLRSRRFVRARRIANHWPRIRCVVRLASIKLSASQTMFAQFFTRAPRSHRRRIMHII